MPSSNSLDHYDTCLEQSRKEFLKALKQLSVFQANTMLLKHPGLFKKAGPDFYFIRDSALIKECCMKRNIDTSALVIFLLRKNRHVHHGGFATCDRVNPKVIQTILQNIFVLHPERYRFSIYHNHFIWERSFHSFWADNWHVTKAAIPITEVYAKVGIRLSNRRLARSLWA